MSPMSLTPRRIAQYAAFGWFLAGMPMTARAEEPADADAGAPLRKELRTVEEQVRDLKERVFRSKSTLALLHEMIVEKARFEAAVSIWHVQALGSGYSMEGAEYYLDGKPIFSWKKSSGTPAPPEKVEIRNQMLDAGRHTLQVEFDVRGNGGGVFSYVRDYTLSLQGSYEFEAQVGQRTIVYATAMAEAGVKKSFTDRPLVNFESVSEELEEE